jgi:ABC-type taurine transport system substrate-binding protein
MRILSFIFALIITFAANLRSGVAEEKLVAVYFSISAAEWTLVSAAKSIRFEEDGVDVSTDYLAGSTRIVHVMSAGDIRIGQIGGSAS